MLSIARRVIWFEEPGTALSNPIRFMAYAFAYASPDDMNAIGRHLNSEDFIEALELAPPGIIPADRWKFWHRHFGRTQIPPLPKRTFPRHER